MSLTAYPFIASLEKEALRFLYQHIKPISIPKNTLLFYQGDICNTILWLSSGKVRLYTQNDIKFKRLDTLILEWLNKQSQTIIYSNSNSCFGHEKDFSGMMEILEKR